MSKREQRLDASTEKTNGNAPSTPKRPKSAARNLVETVLVIGVIVLVLRGCLIEAFKIPSSSMEPYLLGHPYHGDRVLCWKPSLRFGTPERWSVLVFVKHADPFEQMRGETSDRNFIKRVLGLPGESLIIAGGDIYVEGPDPGVPRIARKPPAVQEEVWHAVYESDLGRYRSERPRWELDEGLRHDAAACAIVGRTDGCAFARFARNHYDDDSGLITNLYIRRTSLRVTCPQCGAEFKANFSTARTLATCPSCGAELDALQLSHVSSPSGRPTIGRYPASREEELPVSDIRVSFDVRPASSRGWVLAEIGFDKHRWLARIPLAGGQAKVFGSEGINASAQVKAFPVGRPVRVSFAHVDQSLVLELDGKPAIMAEYEVPWRQRAGRPRTNSVRIGLEAAELSIERPLIERDIHYLAQGHAQFVEFYEAGVGFSDLPRRKPGSIPGSGEADAVRTRKLAEDTFFFMGDNSPSSYDSRMWGPVSRKDLVGKAFFLFWPPHRMGFVR